MSVKIEQIGYDVNVDTNGFDISIATPGPQGPPGPAGEDGAGAVSSVNGIAGDVITGDVMLDLDDIPEGPTNRYFTPARAIASVLSGFSTASAALVTAADTILQAIGKLQAQISAKWDSSGNAAFNTITIGATTNGIVITTPGAGKIFLTGTNVASDRTITIPGSTGTFVLKSTTDTLQNKTLDNSCSVTLKDTAFALQDDADPAKILNFQLSGITTGNARTLTVPDVSGTIQISGQPVTTSALAVYNSGAITTATFRAGTNSNSGVTQPVISVLNAGGTQTAGVRGDGLIFSTQIGSLDDSTVTLVDGSIANSTIPAGLCLGFGARITWSSYTWWFAKDLGISRVNPGVLGVGDSAYGAANAAILCKRLVEANTAVAASPNVITAHEGRTVFTNEGATAKNYHTLPTAVAGYDEEFIVQDSDGMRITAASGDTIRIESSVSAPGGYIESTVVGSTIRLVSINATEWIATAKMGTWTVT